MLCLSFLAPSLQPFSLHFFINMGSYGLHSSLLSIWLSICHAALHGQSLELTPLWMFTVLCSIDLKKNSDSSKWSCTPRHFFSSIFSSKYNNFSHYSQFPFTFSGSLQNQLSMSSNLCQLHPWVSAPVFAVTCSMAWLVVKTKTDFVFNFFLCWSNLIACL